MKLVSFPPDMLVFLIRILVEVNTLRRKRLATNSMHIVFVGDPSFYTCKMFMSKKRDMIFRNSEKNITSI